MQIYIGLFQPATRICKISLVDIFRRPDYIYSAGVIEICRRNSWKEHVNNWRRKEEKAYRELNDIL